MDSSEERRSGEQWSAEKEFSVEWRSAEKEEAGVPSGERGGFRAVRRDSRAGAPQGPTTQNRTTQRRTTQNRTKRPSMDDDERERLIERISQAEACIRRLAIQQGDIGLFSSDLTVQQIRVLLILAVSGERSSHDLASALGVGPTTVTGIVDRLEARGLVHRKTDLRDRRVRLVALSEEGDRMVGELIELHRAHTHRLLRRLEPRLLANLAEAMEALEALVTEEFRA